jgi:hypothetical protein
MPKRAGVFRAPMRKSRNCIGLRALLSAMIGT